jgi:hypothetical protein
MGVLLIGLFVIGLHLPGGIGLVAGLLLYLVLLGLLTTALRQLVKFSKPLLPVFIHGSFPALLFIRRATEHAEYRLTTLDLIGCVIAGASALAYFTLDWRLAGNSISAPSRVPNIDN